MCYLPIYGCCSQQLVHGQSAARRPSEGLEVLHWRYYNAGKMQLLQQLPSTVRVLALAPRGQRQYLPGTIPEHVRWLQLPHSYYERRAELQLTASTRVRWVRG